jgi:hypothetical protein
MRSAVIATPAQRRPRHVKEEVEHMLLTLAVFHLLMSSLSLGLTLLEGEDRLLTAAVFQSAMLLPYAR